jgi:hypothetical protein
MELSRTYRFLRVAVTALSLTACVLLCALWVRSQNWQDRLIRHSTANIEVRSYHSQTIVEITPDENPQAISTSWELKSRLADHFWRPRSAAHRRLAALGVSWGLKQGTYYLFLPHWLLVLFTATLAFAPWIKWRFSLRTLLIATTLVAVGLGAIIAAN